MRRHFPAALSPSRRITWAASEPIQIGIGLNTGMVAVGIAGTQERTDACAFGNTVNIAARCEGLTKRMNAPTIMKDSTFQRLSSPQAFEIRDLGEIEVCGIKERIHVHEVVDFAPHP